ncbi:RNA methyltransferase [Thermoleophilia bacterium SCSIO 60948]|nr:RNA methyltransferase [Thermoleophilia bacterium SCSIO 60948]
MTITSPDNEKLKLARRLARRRRRAEEGLYVTEGEDLLAAGLAAGIEPRFALVAAGSGIDGGGASEEVEPELLGRASALGSGTRAIAVWPLPDATPVGPVCTYLHGVSDPGNVGAIVRSAHALTRGSLIAGPGTADPYGPRAVRASMGSVHALPIATDAIEATPEPRIALVAHGGESIEVLDRAAAEGDVTVCLGAERDGLPADVLARCQARVTIELQPGGAESLGVAAAAAIALGRVSSAAARRGA